MANMMQDHAVVEPTGANEKKLTLDDEGKRFAECTAVRWNHGPTQGIDLNLNLNADADRRFGSTGSHFPVDTWFEQSKGMAKNEMWNFLMHSFPDIREGRHGIHFLCTLDSTCTAIIMFKNHWVLVECVTSMIRKKLVDGEWILPGWSISMVYQRNEYPTYQGSNSGTVPDNSGNGWGWVIRTTSGIIHKGSSADSIYRVMLGMANPAALYE